MNYQYAALMAQMPYSWHQDSLLMGMHWAWLIFVVGIVLIVRRRFAQSEISEEQFAETLRVLRESR
jgi:hypothetical protein